MSVLERFALTGRKALVTGGSSGIGREIALELAQAGADVGLAARRADRLEAVAREIRSLGRRAFVRPVDLDDPGEARALVADVEAALAPIDILVYAAGITLRVPTQELELSDYERIQRTNCTSAYTVAREVGKSLLARGAPGSLIFIASLLVHGARPTILSYTVSKGALRSLTQALAVEWGPKGIRANAIAPGYIRTELTKPLYENPDFDAWVRTRTPADRWGEVTDVAPLAVFLAGDASSFINGQVIYADGGWSAAV
ncbi:MAG: SDR family oxidoreductase [Planctomycetota bacterium]